MLGLTSVYREGFETVLFLQSLQLAPAPPTVLEGAALGLAATLARRRRSRSRLQRKLPYKRMLVVTGVMIGFVLVVMVGKTARTMQGIGWLPITPIAACACRTGSGLWFGVFPTWEGALAQVGARRLRDRQLPGRRGVRKRRRNPHVLAQPRRALPSGCARPFPDSLREPVE